MTSFTRSLYRRLLRSGKIIDNNSLIAFQSILCGKPSSLYSYEFQKNIEIGTNSYSVFDKFVSILNDGEYSSPMPCCDVSLHSIIRNTAKLCLKDKVSKNTSKDDKFFYFAKYFQNMSITEEEAIEIVNDFELLALIATKQAQRKKQDITNEIFQEKEEEANTFESDTIEWSTEYDDKQLQELIIDVLLDNHTNEINEKKEFEIDTNTKHLTIFSSKPQSSIAIHEPILEYISKSKLVEQSVNNLTGWRNSILCQHPLASLSKFNSPSINTINNITNNIFGCNENNNNSIEPQVLLGLIGKTIHKKIRFGGGTSDESYRISLILNGEKTLINICDIVEYYTVTQTDKQGNKLQVTKKQIETYHGIQNIPEIFMSFDVFIGGDDHTTVEILTSNPYCKGIPILGNKLFWNPDLSLADRIIQSGYGTTDQFRFYKGKMKWDNNLYQNIIQRNLYSYISTQNNTSLSYLTLSRLIWPYQNDAYDHNHNNNNNNNSLWYTLLQHISKTNTNDIQSWIQLFNLLNENHSNIKNEIHQLMEKHDGKISQQVKLWYTQNLKTST